MKLVLINHNELSHASVSIILTKVIIFGALLLVHRPHISIYATACSTFTRASAAVLTLQFVRCFFLYIKVRLREMQRLIGLLG